MAIEGEWRNTNQCQDSQNVRHWSRGTLRYSPKLLGQKSEKWWLVLDCDPELGRYYRELYQLASWHCRILRAAAWKEHVSVIANEEPPDTLKSVWEKYTGLSVEFQYQATIHTDGLFYWLPVYCNFLHQIREELGLPREPFYPFHLTVGNCKEMLK